MFKSIEEGLDRSEVAIQRQPAYSLLLFPNTMEALAFDERAKEAGLTGRLIPVPRELSSSCGLCWRESYEHLETLRHCSESSENSVLIEQWK